MNKAQNPVRAPAELGSIVRRHRKSQGITLEELADLTGLGVRFLSEFERGKPTAEIGKVLEALATMGLEVYVVPRQLAPRVNELLAKAERD
ncbi:MAG: helix-turn-helix domain-containing protein [Aquisalimonadaceae bacterium]